MFYYNTRGYWFSLAGDRNGYVGGQFGENFPSGITAAFSRRDFDGKLWVYLFKGDQYCTREYDNPAPVSRLTSN